MNFFNQFGQINPGGADCFACTAVNAVLNQIPCIVSTMEKISQNQTNGTNIDMPHLMTTYHTIYRADIGTGTTTHAAQYLIKGFIFSQFPTSIIQKNNMHFFLFVGFTIPFRRARHPGHIGGNGLAGCISGKHFNNGQCIFQSWNQFFKPHQSHMNPRQCCHQSSITFIGIQPNGGSIGNGKISPAYSNICLDKFLA